MHGRFNQISAIIMLASTSLAVSPVSQAAANFSEGFDDVGPTNGAGPQNLIDQGWIFRSQSQPAGVTVWRQGRSFSFPNFTPQSGNGYLTNWASWDDGNRNVSAWALLPALPGQSAGDVISCYAAGAVTENSLIQLRYSPTGGTSTGSSYTDVGDFTQVLAEIVGPPAPNIGDWAQLLGNIPGSGRLAIRWYEPPLPSFVSPFIGIDTLVVGPPPCNAPPLPGSGQTVTWTVADSPYQICGSATIPAGATVNVEPGVTVSVDSGFSLTVEGTLQGAGTAGSPIVFSAAAVYPAMLAVTGGTVDLDFADIGGQIRPYSGATLLLTDCTFAGYGLIWSNGTDSGPLQYVQPYVRLERCAFNGTGATLTDCVTTLRQATVSDGAISVLRGSVDTTGGVTVTGGVLSISDEAEIQPVYVDSVTATGQASGAGLVLAGANFALGPNNVLQSNLYPVEVRGGVWPGSVVPTTGNTNNRIYFGGSGAQTHYARWANVGVPYRVDSFIDTPPLLVEPGCTVEFTPSAFFRFVAGTPLLALGQPEAPVTFKAAQPGQPWDVIIFGSSGNTGRLEYCTIQEANIGVVASDALIWLDNIMFQNNSTGANANTFGELVLRKSRFAGNGAAISFDDLGGLSMNAPGNPNSFEGNGAAIQTLGFDTQADARNNWWNSPSGPQSPLNPGGTGDAIAGPGASGVQVTPFRTSQPDFTNHPPVIRLVRPSYLLTVVDAARYLDPGQKVVLRWSATDDDTIVSQRVLVSPAGNWPTAFTIAVDIPATAQTYELTIPDVGFDPSSSRQFIRVVATDSHGQEGWDEIPCVISSGRLLGTVTLDVPAAGQTFYAGDAFPPYTRTVAGFDGWFPSFDDYLIYEADGSIYSSGGPVGQIPNVSTDLARYWTKVYNNSNDVRWFAGPYITIRHDPRLGFEPPTVQLQTPAAGSSYVGGTVVPITWTATAAEGLRSFDLQVSTDGGRFWRLLVQDLPAAARAYDWQLPPSGGIPDVQVRVIARDTRFQNSSDGTSRSFAITAGQIGDLNCDRVVDFGDINPLVLALSDPAGYAAAYPNCNILSGDCNGDGSVDFDDINAFIVLLSGF